MPPPSSEGSNRRTTTALVALAAASVAATVVFACYLVADMERPGAGMVHARRLLGRANLRALPPPARRAAALLARTDGARHLLAAWPPAGVKDAEKAALVTKAAAGVSGGGGAAAPSGPRSSTAPSAAAAAPAAAAVAATADALEAERLRLLPAPQTARLADNLVAAPHPGLPPRADPYQWLRDDARTNATVLSHLRAENDHTRAALADTEPLQRALYREMRSRIRESDSDVPTRIHGYWRYSFTREGDQYRTHVRVKVPEAAAALDPTERDAPPEGLPVEVLLDENKRRAAVKAEFYSMSGLTVSPDGRLVAWAEDVEGGERYDVVVAEAATGRVLPATFGGRRPVKGTSGDIAWAADSRTLVYVVKDAMDRPYKVLRRKYALGAEEEKGLLAELKKEQQQQQQQQQQEEGGKKKNATAGAAAPANDDSNGDALVFVDPDEAYYVDIGISSSDEYLLISSGSAVTSETLVLPRADPAATPRVFLPRTPDVEYSLDHHTGVAGAKQGSGGKAAGSEGKGWWVYTYRDAERPNSELRAAPEGAEARPGALRADPPPPPPPPRAASPSGGGEARPAAPPAVGSEVAVLLPHRDDVKLENFGIASRYLAVFERKGGNQRAVVYPLPTTAAAATTTAAAAAATTPVPMPSKALANGRELAFDEPAYSLGGSLTGDFDASVLRMAYQSLRTPSTVIDEHLPTGRREERKVAPVLNHFSKDDYVTERVWVPSRSEADVAAGRPGVEVPVAVVYRRDLFKRDGSSPMLLSGYGSYESSNDPYFSVARLALLDRGVAYAVAQVRGGGDMGRQWYEDGKLLRKRNTFEDFVAAARWLAREGYTSGDRLAIEGRSAGGLLMGAALNMAPRDTFRAALVGVGFLDALNTMLDPTLPLTVTEYEEWGNPTASKEAYEYMLSYSPYDNVSANKTYPHILATAGLRDPRVSYWEPAKWVAAVRAARGGGDDASAITGGARADRGGKAAAAGGNKATAPAPAPQRPPLGEPPALPPLTLLKTDMGAGHFSVTGRFARLKETALEYAFLLKVLGRARTEPLRGTGPDPPGVVPAGEE
jgi:oligopeptidase B